MQRALRYANTREIPWGWRVRTETGERSRNVTYGPVGCRCRLGEERATTSR
jgi:hypothetical protein